MNLLISDTNVHCNNFTSKYLYKADKDDVCI